MKRQLLKWAGILAVSLAFLGMAAPLTAFANDALAIGAMGEGEYAINVAVSGGRGAKVTFSINGTQGEVQEVGRSGGTVSAQAKQGDAVSVSVAPKGSGWMVKSFTAADSDGTAVECQEEKTLNDAGDNYGTFIYSFTMPVSDVAATCALDGSNLVNFTAYCTAGWEDFDFTFTDKSGEPMPLSKAGVLDESAGANQGVSYRKYLVESGDYEYTMIDVKANTTIDSGTLSLNPGSSALNWNLLNVTVEPAVVEELGSFGAAGCTCTRADGEEKLPIASSEDESGLYTATFLLRGGAPGVGSTDYTVSVTPKDERCSVTWKTGWEDSYNYSGDSINVTNQVAQRCGAKAFVRASDVMVAQGQAITELGGYDPENYLEAQQAEITQLVADATEAIRAAETEDAVAAALASAKQALDAVETAEQAQAAAAPVSQAIAALPAAGELTAESADAVKAARAAYDALTDAQKAAVGEAGVLKLELAEAVLEKLGLEQQVAALDGENKALSGEKAELEGKLADAEKKVGELEDELAQAKATPAAKKANPMEVTAKAKNLKAKALKKKAKAFKAIAVKNAKGAVTYAKVKVNKKKFAKKFAVNKKTGKVTVKKGVKKGTYKVTVKVSAAGDASYEAASKNVVVKVTVK